MSYASRCVGVMVCGLTILAAVLARAGEDAPPGGVALDRLPPAVRATIEKEAKAAAIRSAKTVYQAEFYVQGEDQRQKVVILVDADGRLIDRRPNELLTMADLPQAVRALILAEPKGDEVADVERRVRRGETTYQAETGEDHGLSIRVDRDGKVVYVRCEMPFPNAPEAVRAAIQKRAPDADVQTITRVTAEGRTGFRGELDSDGQHVTFEVDPNGTILRWDIEDEGDDDDEEEGEEPPPVAPAPQKAPDAHML